jgi:hypothetical protein
MVTISKEYQERLDSLPDDELKPLRLEFLQSFERYKAALSGALGDDVKEQQERLIFESKSLEDFKSNLNLASHTS